MEIISLKDIDVESRIQLLRELGYDSDGIFVLNSDGTTYIEKYLHQPVLLDKMIIVPGSALVLDDNPLSLASYIEEYGDLF